MRRNKSYPTNNWLDATGHVSSQHQAVGLWIRSSFSVVGKKFLRMHLAVLLPIV